MNRTQQLLLPLVWLLVVAVTRADTIRQSKHNLSVTGKGVITAAVGANSSEVCIFCHTPHTAVKQRALWNRFDAGVTYTPYSSSTLKAIVGQPTGASKLCLSCHDGTVALGRIRSRSKEILMKGMSTIPRGRNNLGTDLSDDHPISFKYDEALVTADGQLQRPPKTGRVHLDENDELQCTSCHDAHNDQSGKFLVINNTGSALCITCHDIRNWRQSSHSTAIKTWNGVAQNPWPHTTETTVAANGCENCHDPHSAGGKQRLLNYAAEEQNCFSCHNGNVAAKNVQADFNKSSAHPVINTTGVHDPMETTLSSGATGRHVECVDCHNPHATYNAASTTPGGISGALSKVRGISASGAEVPQVTYEYELCFRCHGDTAKGPAQVSRQFPQLNTRQEFQDAGGTNSFHPVVFQGRNPNDTSLRPPLTSSSKIGCGDCHNSDSSANSGGAGPNGPHGSIYPPLLERMLSLGDTASNPSNSALCFKCHNFDNNAWSGHVKHMGYTSCMTCHDPHGSPNAHLINFDPSIVTGGRSYQSKGLNHGNCTLTCHGVTHDSGQNNSSY